MGLVLHRHLFRSGTKSKTWLWFKKRKRGTPSVVCRICSAVHVVCFSLLPLKQICDLFTFPTVLTLWEGSTGCRVFLSVTTENVLVSSAGQYRRIFDYSWQAGGSNVRCDTNVVVGFLKGFIKMSNAGHSAPCLSNLCTFVTIKSEDC